MLIWMYNLMRNNLSGVNASVFGSIVLGAEKFHVCRMHINVNAGELRATSYSRVNDVILGTPLGNNQLRRNYIIQEKRRLCGGGGTDGSGNFTCNIICNDDMCDEYYDMGNFTCNDYNYMCNADNYM